MTALFALVAVTVNPTAAQAAPVSFDAQAGGLDAATFAAADIVHDTGGNSIQIRYTFTTDVTDGDLEVHLPTRDWPTPLQPVGAVNPESTSPGSAIVRPSSEVATTDGSQCQWGGAAPDVDRLPSEQVVRISPVTCSAGQHLDVRVLDVRSPRSAGTYDLMVSESDADSGAAALVPVVVKPTPEVVLTVSAPNSVPVMTPFPIRITAMREGRVATGYRGAVGVLNVGRTTCSDLLSRDQIAYRFTAADAGTAVIWVTVDLSQRLIVRDIANQAVSGQSNRFHLTAGLTNLVCPVSYH